LPSFANRAPFLSLWAPGSMIRAPWYLSTNYVTASGTSMAAPHAAGAWALLRQAVPGAGVDEILGALQATGVPIIHTTRIRVAAALDELGIACADGFDDDGDGLVDLADPGCEDAADDSELGSVQCDNGEDDDEDGFTDSANDPGCSGAEGTNESPRCQDGVDNDGDGRTDFDGGASLNGGVPFDEPDPQCTFAARDKESAGSCGLGFELAPILAVLWARRRRRP
jgi:subtilisin family serine protease